MYLEEVFNHLISGELVQTPLGGTAGSFIGEQDYVTVVPMIQLGLTALHKMFPLRSSNVIVQQYDAIQEYVLHSKYAMTNTSSLEPVKYIEDTATKPFKDNILRIETIYDEDGKELFINDDNRKWSVYTTSFNTVLVPYPSSDNIIEVIYRADHDKIPLTNLEPSTQEINISAAHLEPLLYFIAARMYDSLPGLSKDNVGKDYYNKYLLALKDMQDTNSLQKETPTNIKLNARGFV